MAIGDIGTTIANHTFESSACYDPSFVYVAGTTYAVAYQGPDIDGWLKTVSISTDGATMATLDSLEFDASNGENPCIIHVAEDIFAIAYKGVDDDGFLITLSIAADGTIGAIIDTLEFDTSDADFPYIFRVHAGIFGIVYKGVDGNGWLKTLSIDNGGNIGAVIDSLEFDTSDCSHSTVLQITDKYFLLFYSSTSNNAMARVLEIENDGTITGEVSNKLIGLGDGLSPQVIRSSGNMYAFISRDGSVDGWIKTHPITNGVIGSQVDSLEFSTDSADLHITKLASGVIGIVYKGASADGFIDTYSISVDGTIGSQIDTYEYDTGVGAENYIIHINSNVYAIAHRGDINYGIISTITIDNSYTIDQGLPSNTPSIHVFVHGDSYDTTEIAYIESDEMMYGSRWIIRLDNSDQGLNSKSYVGRLLYVTFGFSDEGEVEQQELTVYKQRFVSLEGTLMLELECIDAWGLLAVTNPGLGEFWNYPDQASGEVNEDTDHYDKTILYIMSTIVQNAIGKSILFDDDDDVINDYSPAIRIVNDRSSLRQLVEMTETYLYWGADGNFHVIKPDDHGVVYTYNDDNSFWVAVDEDTLVIPNRVRFYGTDSSGSVISADANDSTSQTALGYVVPRYYYYGVQEIAILDTTAKCQALANATMSKIQDEIAAGYVEAPMHCSQKLYDKITITDTRSGKTTTGYIHRIQRTYNPSAENNNDVYKIAIFLGGQMTGFTPDSGAPSMPMIERAPLESSQTARPHIENMGFTESALLIDQDINDNTTVSADINLDRNKLYTAYVQGSNQTDTVEQWGLTISGTSSDGNVFYSKTHGPHDETITYTAITFFTGSLGGAWQPKITINIFNGTGGVRHFHGKIYYAQIG